MTRRTVRSRAPRTFGLTHLALGVSDPKRAFAFYREVFSMVAVFDDGHFLQAQTPGARDVLVFERTSRSTGRTGSIAHFGFRLKSPDDLRPTLAAVRRAGGRVLETGEFVPGEPYAFIADLDGYTVEVWYEIPTAVDPRTRRRRGAARRRR